MIGIDETLERRASKHIVRLPTLQTLSDLPSTTWTIQQVMWYDHPPRTVHLHSFLAVWSPDGTPPVTVRCLLMRTFDSHSSPHTQALLSSDLTFAFSDTLLLTFFMRRWQLEVTFQLVRTHLGVETQRQWSPLAIARTTPALLGLFSFVTLFAHVHWRHAPLPPRACYTLLGTPDAYLLLPMPSPAPSSGTRYFCPLLLRRLTLS